MHQNVAVYTQGKIKNVRGCETKKVNLFNYTQYQFSYGESEKYMFQDPASFSFAIVR